MASTLTSEVTEPSRTYFYHPMIRIPYYKKKVSYNAIGATGLTVMRSTLKNLPEHLGKNSEEHFKAPSSICGHQNITGHKTTMDNFSIVGSGAWP